MSSLEVSVGLRERYMSLYYLYWDSGVVLEQIGSQLLVFGKVNVIKETYD